jgi:putative acetyltransferase
VNVVLIRLERPGDIQAIRALNDRAFGRTAEGAAVDLLRDTCQGLVSVVAVVDGTVAGHVLFSPAWIETEDAGKVAGLGLAPLAVLPEYQGQGIGTELTSAALALVRRTPCPFVIVLGNPSYYRRFGFEPAQPRRITCKWDVPEDAFMILILDEETMRGVAGPANYRPEWDAAT